MMKNHQLKLNFFVNAKRCVIHAIIQLLFLLLYFSLFDLYFTPLYSKVCDEISIDDIIIEESSSGVTCKVLCPPCENQLTLSYSVNNKTGKVYFSCDNFKTHFKTMHKSITQDDYEIGQGSSENAVSCTFHEQKIDDLGKKY